MTNGEQTRNKVMEADAPIFNKRGYEGTSVNDLMEATAGPLVAKTSDGLNLSVQMFGNAGNDENSLHPRLWTESSLVVQADLQPSG
jgi:hypothetical protein